MAKDKRTHARVPFTARVTVYCKGQPVISDADTRNISLKGMYIKTDKRLGVGTHCGLALLLSGVSSRVSLNIDGRVVREDERGIGVVFNTIDLDSYFHLKNILLYNTTNAEALSDYLPMDTDDLLPDSDPAWEDA